MVRDIYKDKILILDFGSQYSQLIARRVRECGVYCEIHAYDFPYEDAQTFNPSGIILSGGPETVTHANSPRIPDYVLAMDCPILGICYGMQAMVAQCGGQIKGAEKSEFGHAEVKLTTAHPLFGALKDNTAEDGSALLDVWMSHGDKVETLAPGFITLATTDNCPHAAVADLARQYIGVQFHPEVTHTKQGQEIIAKFVHEICGADTLWIPENIIDVAIQQIKETVGEDKVVLGLSGGVDSSVVASLVYKAIGEQLTCVFVDNGLLRLNESEQVQETFGKQFGMDIIVVDAKQRFLSALQGIDCPEEKRKCIGNLFVEIFEEQAAKLNGVKWLAQGTIYPDVIESAGSKHKTAHVIKSHHNVGGLPEKMGLSLLEPLRELFKDEVRKIGLALGLAYDLVYRHPFPGPGLAVRILGEVKADFVKASQQADHIFIEELHLHDLYHRVSQAFVVFLPVKSVGVVGDARQYEYVVSLRAVETIDFMTASWAHLPYDFLQKVSSRIINEVKGISRVVYDISNKPPATIEWE